MSNDLQTILSLASARKNLDEVGNLDGRDLSAIVHKISTGKASMQEFKITVRKPSKT